MSERQAYPSDLTDAEWALLEPLLPPHAPTGRPREHDLRDIADAIFYILRSGCAWRMLPHDYPPHSTVYKHFALWRESGLWQRILDTLRHEARRRMDRHQDPSALIIDSQSVKTTEKGGPAATTPARRWRVASGTSSSTPRASSSR